MSGFPERLKEARLRAGLSQPELADKVDVDKSYISKLERGIESPPSRKVTLRLVDALGISDPEERNEFLITAGVFNEEDYDGYALVKVAGRRTRLRSPLALSRQKILLHRLGIVEKKFQTAAKFLNELYEELCEIKALVADTQSEEEDRADASSIDSV